MSHPFLEDLSTELNSAGIATFRYQFPYMENHRKVPDPPAVLTGVVRTALEKANHLAPDLPLFAGGKSMGGRMTSIAASEQPLGIFEAWYLLVFRFTRRTVPGRNAQSTLRVSRCQCCFFKELAMRLQT